MDSIKDVVRSSVKVPEFSKHLKKARRHISRNFVEITIKMKTIVRKPYHYDKKFEVMILLHLKAVEKNALENYCLQTARPFSMLGAFECVCVCVCVVVVVGGVGGVGEGMSCIVNSRDVKKK